MTVAKTSHVRLLLNAVIAGACRAVPRTRERVVASMSYAVRLAVASGMEFEAGDFRYLDSFDAASWRSDDGEWVYSLAVREGNYSACRAWEEYVGRPPLIADDVTVDAPWGETAFSHKRGRRARERLHVGARFRWRGDDVRVTSFGKDGRIRACSYADDGSDGNSPTLESVVRRRHRISRDDLVRDREERAERQVLHDELVRVVGSNDARRMRALKLLRLESGPDGQRAFDALPLHRIRKAVERLRSEVGDTREEDV